VLEFAGVIPSEVMTREEKPLEEEDTEIHELATLSSTGVGLSGVLGFWGLEG